MTQEIIESALINGIMLIDGDTIKKAPGFISITFLKALNEFGICYGDEEIAGYVLVKDFGVTWTNDESTYH